MRSLHRTLALAALFSLSMVGISARAQFLNSRTPVVSEPGPQRPLTTDPAILFPPNRDITFLPGDLLKVSIPAPNAPYLDSVRVSLNGAVTLSQAGVIQLGGLTLQEGQAAIAARMEQLELYRNPQVSIDISEAPGHIATVLGGDSHGSVPIIGHRTLFEVLAIAGGIPASASSIVTINRPGLDQPIIVDLGHDPANSPMGTIPIFAGDTISLGNVGAMFVMGAVRTPGLTKLNGLAPTTVMQAISLAGGASFEAKLNHTRLIRTNGNQRSVVELHVAKILDGKEPDPILQAEDILYIPRSNLKATLATGGLGAGVALLVAVTNLTR